MPQLHTRILKFVFQQVGKREAHSWLGAPRVSRIAERDGEAKLLPILHDWDLIVDKRTQKRLQRIESLPSLLEHFMLKGVRLDSHMGLWGLASGHYPLQLRTDIPSPSEMLDLQCEGKRCVTYLDKEEDLHRRVGRFSGAYEFLMHDLEHAHKFFGDPLLHRAQVNFFKRLRAVLPLFEEWQQDPLFTRDMDYLASDMNSHPVHLFKYLKAIVLTAELRKGRAGELDDFWNSIFDRWKLEAFYRAAGLRINHPALETENDRFAILNFFSA